MPAKEVDIVHYCGECGTEIETVSIKKDNMMLSSNALVWCPKCQTERPEVLDVAGRLDSIKKEQQSYPKAVPAKPFSDRSSRSSKD